jgi:hypothetical protein
MRNRLVATLVASVCTAVLLVACAEGPSSTSPVSGLAPKDGPQFGYVTPFGCAVGTDISACGQPGDGLVHTEQLQVCKQYPVGTVNPPAVQIQLDVVTDNAPRGPQTGLIFTLQPNSCRIIWQNGELFGPNADAVTVTEVAPAGYTATSQVTTIRRNGPRDPGNNTYTTTVNPSTSATTVTGTVGGYEIPGMLVVFTNTAIPEEHGPGCTLTQGYWKNHESAWPAPYSATAQWMSAGHLVNGTTWDGLMETAPKGGNSYIQLAHQWIAATLNSANGASVPANVQTTLADAEAWLVANTPATGPVPFVQNAQATAWAGVLDSYNTGATGPGHCTE